MRNAVSRREFLRLSAVVTGGAVMAACAQVPAAPAPAPAAQEAGKEAPAAAK